MNNILIYHHQHLSINKNLHIFAPLRCILIMRMKHPMVMKIKHQMVKMIYSAVPEMWSNFAHHVQAAVMLPEDGCRLLPPAFSHRRLVDVLTFLSQMHPYLCRQTSVNVSIDFCRQQCIIVAAVTTDHVDRDEVARLVPYSLYPFRPPFAWLEESFDRM
jgi:hypothetical protein